MELILTLFPAVFLGGVLMFLAPCTLPLVPAFIASLLPPYTQGRTDSNSKQFHFEFFRSSVLFTLGFTTIFVIFGTLAGYLGSTITIYKTLLSQVGGVFIVLFGISMLSIFNIPLLTRSISFMGSSQYKGKGSRTPFVLGTLFGLGWAPCAGPILVAILILTSQSATALQGAFLLLIFSLGLALPFILTGIVYGHIFSFFSLYERHVRLISIVSGILLIVMGLALIFNQYILMTGWGFALYSFLGYTPMCTYI